MACRRVSRKALPLSFGRRRLDFPPRSADLGWSAFRLGTGGLVCSGPDLLACAVAAGDNAGDSAGAGAAKICRLHLRGFGEGGG